MVENISHDSETPARGQQVITACAFIHHNFDGIEKVFLPKRSDTKKFLPGVYELPGGHIDYGEDIVKGLEREIMEEFGKRATIGDPFATFTYLNEIKGSHSVEIIYYAAFADSLENVTLHPEDHSQFEWVAEDELQKVFTEHKKGDDPEIQAIEKGFSLLRGESLAFH
ncbi:MAG: NUDIX hydrolase [Candidatus Moraniibacteriota bacterium]